MHQKNEKHLQKAKLGNPLSLRLSLYPFFFFFSFPIFILQHLLSHVA